MYVYVRINLIDTDSVYTVIVRFMTCMQNLSFKLKFCMVIIHLTLTVHALSGCICCQYKKN